MLNAAPGEAGIPVDALDFYDDLAVENTRAWWQANRARWEASVREPMERLVDALAPIALIALLLGAWEAACRLLQ